MKHFIVTVAMLTAMGGAPAVAVFGQWPNYPTPGVPKMPDGKPNLSGPVPRTADGHPDLTGIWEYYRERGPVAAAGGNITVNAPAPIPGASTGLGPVTPNTVPFFNIGVEVKGGLPFTSWAVDLRKQRSSANNKDNPDAHCLPLGLMQLHLHPQPRKIIQTPAVIVVLYEANGGVRQIFMDGRPLPKNNPQPWWYGYSVGKWDGDTLVVESSGFRDDVWLDVEGSPLTESGKITERIRRVNYCNLEIDVTVEDPKSYTKPWTVTVKQKILLDNDLIEFVCAENEKDAPHLVSK
jgi:hypothetical protein